jgi:hypothetical protein
MISRGKAAAALCKQVDGINRPVSWGNRLCEKISFVATHNSVFESTHNLKEVLFGLLQSFSQLHEKD